MIRFDRVSKSYPGGNQALSDVSFELEPAEFVYLTGHSGAGKSTLLKLIAMLERPTRGHVLFDGRNLGKVGKWGIPYHRRKVGLIFQDHKLLQDRTVFDNVALPLVITGMGHREIRRRVQAALDQVELLHKEHALPATLSGGEQQRVGIARAVVGRPPMLVADEPTGNLDPALSREIMSLFERFQQVGVTVMVASHDHRLIRETGRRVLTLRDGRMTDAELMD
ncbi:cell division transport system ATP-binding protein [Natronospira proteinivora]|uniref:Cell division ATP-binding protein FtsE n=1 Tax=Natronospira proteinivora TaxID=1807133 RepID=A0ABT1G9D2_9GAMM|nr:cell division ATP-binding protein FtsE [Natronospira proteinivora]MCP1727939.1 cell division transport system ATP-binding protein [Natronospira proteinivora]